MSVADDMAVAVTNCRREVFVTLFPSMVSNRLGCICSCASSGWRKAERASLFEICYT